MGLLKSNSDEPEIRIEYKPQNIDEPIDEYSIPDLEYYSSPGQERVRESKIQQSGA